MDDSNINDFDSKDFDSKEDLKKRREELRQKLRESKAYREQYGASALVAGISNQIVALRRQRGFKQEDLSRVTGIKQPRISKIEKPQFGEDLPNWELDTLNRIAQGFDCRLKITFETYGSLVEELGSATPESLRRSDVESDRILNPLPDVMPQPDPGAPERTQWMQEGMIPWLYDDDNPAVESSLKRWLQGYGLPPVGQDESPSQWILRGIPVQIPAPVRDKFERRLAERLQILLEQEPDLHSDIRDRPEEYLIELYSVCAGLRRLTYLVEPLWANYKRLHQSKLRREVRTALQAAILTNHDDRAVNEIWMPMVENGKHRLLPGRELTGIQGMMSNPIKRKADYGMLLGALQTISHRWTGTPDDIRTFDQIIESFRDRRVLLHAVWSGEISLSAWAKKRLPIREITLNPKGIGGLTVAMPAVKCSVDYRRGDWAELSIDTPNKLLWQGDLFGIRDIPEKESFVYNTVSTRLGDVLEDENLILRNNISFIKDAFWLLAKQSTYSLPA